MAGTLLEFPTGKVILVFPTFQMLAGDYDFPLWFVREGIAQLSSKEPFMLFSGIGLVLRYWPLVTSIAPQQLPRKAFENHILEYPRNFSKSYLDIVIKSLDYEMDDIREGLDIISNVAPRVRPHQLIRDLKTRRDNVENVITLLQLLEHTKYRESDKDWVDRKARYIRPLLEDNHAFVSVIEPRLNLVYAHDPSCWWGVNDTI